MTAHAPPLDLRLIVITDAEMARPRSLLQVVTAALHAGAPAIQLRVKGASAAGLYDQALQLRSLTATAGAHLFINDRLDVALAADADGVHLGPADLPIAAARAAANAAGRPDLLIGASTDDPDTALRLVAEGADYLGCGAVFGTTSKPDLGQERIGTARLQELVTAAPRPVVGIGGINPGNVEAVAATGAAGSAVIGAVMAAEDVHETVRQLLTPFR